MCRTYHDPHLISTSLFNLSALKPGSPILHYVGCLVIPVMLVDKRWICEFCLKRLQASRLQPDLLQAERLVWRQSSGRRRDRSAGKTSETFQQCARYKPYSEKCSHKTFSFSVLGHCSCNSKRTSSSHETFFYLNTHFIEWQHCSFSKRHKK